MEVSRLRGDSIVVRLTGSEAALVDPGVHVCALILELLELISGVLDFILEILDLIEVGSDGVVEGLGQWIRGGFHCCRGDGTGVCIVRGDGPSPRCGIVTLITSSGGSKGMQFVLRIESARILGVFVGWTLDLLRVVTVGVFGKRSGRH